MTELSLSPDFFCVANRDGFASGEVFHIERNRDSGSVSTPIARFYVSTPPMAAEGYNDHKQVDCYVRQHRFAPDGGWLAKHLTTALIEHGLIVQPIWLSWHRSEEIDGEALGEVFDFDCDVTPVSHPAITRVLW